MLVTSWHTNNPMMFNPSGNAFKHILAPTLINNSCIRWRQHASVSDCSFGKRTFSDEAKHQQESLFIRSMTSCDYSRTLSELPIVLQAYPRRNWRNWRNTMRNLRCLRMPPCVTHIRCASRLYKQHPRHSVSSNLASRRTHRSPFVKRSIFNARRRNGVKTSEANMRLPDRNTLAMLQNSRWSAATFERPSASSGKRNKGYHPTLTDS